MSRVIKFPLFTRKLVRRVFYRAGVEVLRVEHAELLRKQRAALLRAATETDTRAFNSAVPAEGIVFSKDRPVQLEGLLRSYFLHAANPAPLYVLWRAGTPALSRAYNEVESLYATRKVTFIRETSFRPDLLRTLERLVSTRMFFLVDDILFLRPVDFAEIAHIDPRSELLSLRLAPSLTYCYTRNRPLTAPRSMIRKGKGFTWRWQDGELDWGYPQSIDGNVFDTAEMTCLARSLDFKAPNTLEMGLGKYADLLGARPGRCYAQPRLVNIPANRVQNEILNRSGGITIESLLEHWNEGLRIDVESYSGVETVSVHQALPLRFTRRES
jgi:hypothetical protein